MVRPIVLFGLFNFLCWTQLQQAGTQLPEERPDLATIELTVSTTFGEPVGKALAILKSIGPQEQYREIGERIRFDKIPFGLYDLDVQAPGFSTRRERIGIYQTTVRLWIGLSLSPLHGDERPGITGSIGWRGSKPKDLWIRLVPLYSSDLIEDRLDAFGEFHFAGVHPGRYVLLVLDNEKLLLARPVDFSGGKLTLHFDVVDQ